MKKIPEYILVAINNGELKSTDYYEKYGKDNLESELKKIKESDLDILSQIDSEDFYKSVSNQLKNSVPKKNSVFMKYVPIVSAAILLLLFFPVSLIKNHNQKKIVDVQTIRIKGKNVSQPQLFIYRQEKGEARLLKNGAKANHGDIIQIAYNPSGKKYGLIFSIDGNHEITPHLWNDSGSGFVEVNQKISILDFSYELDDAPEYEVFVMVTSDNEINLSENIWNLKSEKLQTILYGKYLPENTEFTTFLLKK